MCGIEKKEILLIKFPSDENIYTTEFSLEHESSVVGFYSFDKKNKKLFKGKIVKITKEEIIKLNITSNNITENKNYIDVSKNDYLKSINEVINVLKHEKISKIVISRQKWINIPSGKSVNLGETFLNLCKDYHNAFIYLFVDKNEAWIGATPEILGKYNKSNNIFQTMSLAGTLPVSESWSNKEIEEQKTVYEYIRSVLNTFSDGEKLEESLIYDYISSDIKHLCNDFKIKIIHKKIPELIEVLHPTPAVCGIPKDLCMEIIGNVEKHHRKFYTGFIHIENTHTSSYYVNLRCAQIYNNGILLYAGGGINKYSQAEKEWIETELKMNVILKRISIANTCSKNIEFNCL